MTTITESVIDLADRHTTMYYLRSAPPTGPLPFYDEKHYCDLHRDIAVGDVKYVSVTGKEGALLESLRPGYSNNKYWKRYLPYGDFNGYPDLAWSDLLPVEASWPSLKFRITYAPETGIKVAPIPRVLLYPFGWSAWVSLRITGEHTLETLAGIVKSLFSADAFQVGDEEKTLSLRDLFDRIAQGVREDAFGGSKAKDIRLFDEVITVTTVLAKYGGSPALGALGKQRQDIMGIVRPEGHPPDPEFESLVYSWDKSGLEYVVAHGYARFIWIDHLLNPFGRNRVWMRCYHNNTFHSLVQAVHLNALIETGIRSKRASEALTQLAVTAAKYLSEPPYKNASLFKLLERPDIKRRLNQAEKLESQG